MAWQDDIRNRDFPARGPLRSGLQLRVLQAGSGHIDEWWRLARVVQPHWVLYRNRTAGSELDLADGRVLPAADDRLRSALERIDGDPAAALPNALLARLCGLVPEQAGWVPRWLRSCLARITPGRTARTIRACMRACTR
jgi:hypothetical protein